MKALTLRHPWAFAVAHLEKRIENRTWKPPSALLGERIAIHGGAVPKGAALTECQADAVWMTQNILTGEYFRTLDLRTMHWLDSQAFFGRDCRDGLSITPGIVATAVLDGFVTRSASPWFFGPYGWVLEDVVTLPEAVPCKGAQGLWELPEDVEKQVLGR